MNSNCVAFISFTPLKRTKNNELAVLDVYNLVIERYFYIISLQGKQMLFQTYSLKYFTII
jgi:hypothetical protein